MRHEREGTFFPGDFALTECTTKRRPATRSLRTADWKIILESLTSSIELYNLRDDPGEVENLWGRGIAYGDSLLGMIHRVPGTRLRGWRIAFTGVGDGSILKADLRLPEGGRLDRVETLTRRTGVAIEKEPGGTGCSLEAVEQGLNMVFVSTRPSSVPLEVTVSKEAGEAVYPVYYGAAGEARLGETLVLDPETGLGTPVAFESFMQQGYPGVHIWWMSGEDVAASRQTSPLSPEEIERLKSLGYIN
jgi:hypothetical protein